MESCERVTDSFTANVGSQRQVSNHNNLFFYN